MYLYLHLVIILVKIVLKTLHIYPFYYLYFYHNFFNLLSGWFNRSYHIFIFCNVKTDKESFYNIFRYSVYISFYNIYENRYGLSSYNYLTIACENTNIIIIGSCEANIDNLVNCINNAESISDDDIKIISVLGIEYNKELIMKHNHATKDVIMFDLILEDYKDIDNNIDGYYSITQLNPYTSSIQLFNKYDVKFYEYYGMLTCRIIEILLNTSESVNAYSFYTDLPLVVLEEYSFQFSNEHLISDSLFFIKVLSNGNYIQKSANLLNIFQIEFGNFYLPDNKNDNIYLYCDWNSENNIGMMEKKYIVLLNEPFDELSMFITTIIDKLPFNDELSYKIIVITYDIKYSVGEKEYNTTIQYLIEKYNPLFIGGKTHKERSVINSLLFNYDLYLFDIFSFNNDECLNRVYHLNINSFKRIYDTLYYFIYRGAMHFYLFLEEGDITDDIFMERQFMKLNESYIPFDIDFHILYKSNDKNYPININLADNCVIYILLDLYNTIEMLNELNENGINYTNCEIIMINDYPLNFYNSKEYRNYYYIHSVLSYTNGLNYYNKYSLDLLQSIEFNKSNTDVFVSAYLSILIYGNALISQSYYQDKLIGELLHEITIPLNIFHETYFSKNNQLNFPTKLFKPYPYREYLINSHIHYVPLIDYTSKICDCRKMCNICYDKTIIKIGFLYDSINYPIESKILIVTSNLILDNYILTNDEINKAYYKPIYFDIHDPEEILNMMMLTVSYNIHHLFGGINQTYIDNIVLYSSTNKLQIWYTNNNYIRNECSEYVFNFGQPFNELFDVFYQSLTINSIDYCAITDCEDIYSSQSISHNNNIIFIKEEGMSNEIVLNTIISTLPKGGFIMLYLKYSDLSFLLMLEDYMNSSFFQFDYYYYLMNPEYYFNSKFDSIINKLSNVFTFSFISEDKSPEFSNLFTSFYGNNYNNSFINTYEVYVTNAIITFLNLSESLQYNMSSVNEYQKSIFEKTFSLPSGDLKISPDYSFIYPISQMKYEISTFLYGKTIYIDPEVTINYKSKCDFRNSTNIDKSLINIYLLSNKEEDYFEISSIINSYLKESSSNINFKFSLKLLPFYDFYKFNISLNDQPSNSIYIGFPSLIYREEIFEFLKKKESVLFYVGYSEPNSCYSNVISMNNYLTTYILQIILYIKEKCSTLIVLYNRKSRISLSSAEFFKDEVEFMNISPLLFINIVNTESLKQFISVNQKLLFEPNCIINFLDNNFTSTLITTSQNIISYTTTLFSFNINDFNFPYSSLINHYIVTNYNPYDKSSELIKEIKRRTISTSIKPYPFIIYSYMTAKYISDYVLNLQSSNFSVNNLLKNINNVELLHPSNLKVRINNANYLNQPLYILFHNSDGFDYISSFSINEETETYPYSLRQRLVCSFNKNGKKVEKIEPIKFGYIYSLGKNEITSFSYKTLLNQIMSLSHLSSKYQFTKRIGIEYYLYNIDNDDNNCRDGLLYMGGRNVEYLFTSNDNVCFNTISSLITNYPNMIYFYSGYTYHNQCIKQIFYNELLPSQVFPSLLSFVDNMRFGSFVLYDSENISSKQYKIILENLISEYSFKVNDYVDTNDIENYENAISQYKISSYIYVGSFESFSIVVDDFRQICNGDSYYLLFISTNQYYLSDSFSYDKNLYFFSSPVYGDSFFNEMLYKYSINKTEHAFSLETSYLSHQIIFDLLDQSNMKDIHNRSVFYNKIYTTKINANERDIYFSGGNNNINRPLIVNNNNQIVKEFVYYIESKVNNTLVCKFDEDLRVVNILILIDDNENKLYLHEFINILISNLNSMIEKHIYFNQTFELFNRITCKKYIENYCNNSNYDILIYVSPKILHCKDDLINQNSDKPIFIITNNNTRICKENIYLDGLIAEQYFSTAISYEVNQIVVIIDSDSFYLKYYYLVFWISEEYKVYYENFIEFMKKYFDYVYVQFNDDYDQIIEFMNRTRKYSSLIFMEQKEELMLQFPNHPNYPYFTNFIVKVSLIVGTINDLIDYHICVAQTASRNDMFYRMMNDAQGSNVMRGYSNYITAIFSTILFLKEVMKISNSVKYDEYKQYLYDIENPTESNVRLAENNIFEKHYYFINKQLNLYRNDYIYSKNQNYDCNIKENHGLVSLSPLYIGLFFCFKKKASFLSINTILDRIYALRKTTYILKKYYIYPIYGSYKYNDNYTDSFLSFLNNTKEDLSVIFLTIPYYADKEIMGNICNDKKIIIFNVDYSIKINSKYFINTGLSTSVYSNFLFKNTIKNSTFVYIVVDESSFTFYSQLFDLYDSAHINYMIISNIITIENIEYLINSVKRCQEYANGHYCSFVILLSYSTPYSIIEYVNNYKENITFFIREGDYWRDSRYWDLTGWYYITTYSPSLTENNISFIGKDADEYNNYILNIPMNNLIDFSFTNQEIVYSSADIYVQLLNKSLSIKPDEIINNLYYSEYHSVSGTLYINDKNSVERRLFTGVFNRTFYNVESYTSIFSSSFYDPAYYTNITYIGVLLDYDEDHQLLSRILLLSINEFIIDENTKGKQFQSKLYILYHNENDTKIIDEMMNDKKINFIMGCVSLYCNNLVIKAMKYRDDKLFFSSIETEEPICEKYVITSSFSLLHKVNITLNYLKVMKISRILYFYEESYQLDFINQIKNEMNETNSVIIDIKNEIFNNYYYINSLLKNYNNTTIILNLLKESRLKSFLELYMNSKITENVYSHLLYYYDYYYIGKELNEKLTNFIIVSSYSGDTRDMSVFLFEQYLQDRLGSNVIISPELASADCLFKLLVSSYTEAMKVLSNEVIIDYGKSIVEYTQILSQSMSMSCALGRIEGTISNTLSHQLYLSEISQTNNLIKIYPDWNIMIQPYNDSNKQCCNGPIIINYEYNRITLIAVLSIFILFTLFYIILLILIIKNKKQNIIKRSSLIILIYAVMSNYLVLIMSIVKNFYINSNWLCKIYDTFTSASIINAILTIVLKSWRIHMIYNNNKIKRVRITSTSIILLCLSLSLIWIFYSLISGLIYDFGVVKVNYSSEYSNIVKEVYITTCGYNLIYDLIEIFVIYAIAGFGVYFSWSTRKVGDSYNESQALVTSIFFICIFIIAYFSIFNMILYKPNERLLFDVVSLGFAGVFCICLMVIPKIYKIYYNTEKLTKNLCCLKITKIFPSAATSTTISPESIPEQKYDTKMGKKKEEKVEKQNNVISHIKIDTFCENASNNIKITINNNNTNIQKYLEKNKSKTFVSSLNVIPEESN